MSSASGEKLSADDWREVEKLFNKVVELSPDEAIARFRELLNIQIVAAELDNGSYAFGDDDKLIFTKEK